MACCATYPCSILVALVRLLLKHPPEADLIVARWSVGLGSACGQSTDRPTEISIGPEL